MPRATAAHVASACLIASGFMARPGSAEALLEPGFFMEYRVETFSGGQRSEEQFRVEVGDDLGGGRCLLVLSLDGRPAYRAVYLADDDRPPAVFDAERFEGVEGFQDGDWLPLAPGDIELLETLRAMEAHLSTGSAERDSTVALAGRSWRAERYSLADSTSTVQESASVTLWVESATRGSAWIAPALPLGGWLRYEAVTDSRKLSEIGGRRFEGAPERSRELWTLVDLGLPETGP